MLIFPYSFVSTLDSRIRNLAWIAPHLDNLRHVASGDERDFAGAVLRRFAEALHGSLVDLVK